jgi:hypothetical protein
MIATALLRSWIRRFALGGAVLTLAGIALGVAAGSASASVSGTTNLGPAKNALLVRADFPSGWSGQGKVTTSQSDNGKVPGSDQMASCLGVPKSLLDVNTPTVTSPDFQDKTGTLFVQDNVSVFPSARSGSRSYAAIASPKVPMCLNTLLQEPAARAQILGNTGSSVTVNAVTVTAVPHSILVPHSAGFTIAFDASEQGSTAHTSLTLVSMVRGTLGSQVTFTSVGQPLSTSLERHLVSVAYGRI